MLNYFETATAKDLLGDVFGTLAIFSIPFVFPYAIAVLKLFF